MQEFTLALPLLWAGQDRQYFPRAHLASLFLHPSLKPVNKDWTNGLEEPKPSCANQCEGTEISHRVKCLSLNQGANPCYNILSLWAEVPASGKGRGKCEQLTGSGRALLCRQSLRGPSGLRSRKSQKPKAWSLLVTPAGFSSDTLGENSLFRLLHNADIYKILSV